VRLVRPNHCLPFHSPQENFLSSRDDRDGCGHDAHDRGYDRDRDARDHDAHDCDRDWTQNHLDADAVDRQSDKNCGNWGFQTKQNLASNIAIPHFGVAKVFAFYRFELLISFS